MKDVMNNIVFLICKNEHYLIYINHKKVNKHYFIYIKHKKVLKALVIIMFY